MYSRPMPWLLYHHTTRKQLQYFVVDVVLILYILEASQAEKSFQVVGVG